MVLVNDASETLLERVLMDCAGEKLLDVCVMDFAVEMLDTTGVGALLVKRCLTQHALIGLWNGGETLLGTACILLLLHCCDR